MNITQELTLDLTRRESSTPIIDLVQGDTVRRIRFYLLCNGEPWNVPENCVVVLRYLKPDGTGGAYDTLDDGAPAWSTQGNVIDLILAPQVCTASGMVQLQVSIHQERNQLSTFSVLLRADKEINGKGESGEYANLAAWIEKHGRGEKGDPGVSPEVEISDIPDGHRVTITDAYGSKYFDVPNSQIPTAHLLRIAALEERSTWELSGNGSVTFEALADSGITFVGKMKPLQSGEGNPAPDNIRPITVTDSVNVSLTDGKTAVTYLSHTVTLPTPCSAGYIDWARRKYVQTYGVKVITGEENWAAFGTIAGGEKKTVRMSISDMYTAATYTEAFDGYCSHYKNAHHGATYGGYDDLIISANKDGKFLCICDKRFGTADEYKGYFAEQYAAGTPVTVVYKLATPVEYDLGALPTLKAAEDTTLFSCDTNDGFIVQYNHDELAVANWEKLRDRADFVVAEGISGDWRYRKWNSGFAECWSSATSVTAVDWDNKLATINKTLPFTFVDNPVPSVSGYQSETATSYITMANATTKIVSAYMKCSVTPGDQYKCHFYFHVVGKWK